MINKIRRFLNRLLTRILRRNRSYKPVGIHENAAGYAKSETGKRAWYAEIYARLVSEICVDEQFYKDCSTYLKPVLRAETTSVVIAIPGGRIHTDNATSVAVIAPDNKLIGDVSFNYQRQKVVSPGNNTIFLQNYFTKPLHCSGTVFSMLTGGAGLNNYFHWLVDTLPRLHLLHESGIRNSIDLFLVPSYQYRYQQDSLRILGIGPENIIEGRKYPHITADVLVASTAPRGDHAVIPEWVCTFLRKNYLNSPVSLAQPSARVYINRRDSAIRHVVNEEALELLLATYGFRSVTLSALSFEEQVNLFACTEMIIAPHGAGLINLVFCRKNTQVIELFARGYVKATYYDLSKKLGLGYQYLLGEGQAQVNNAKQGMKLNIQIDLEKIKVLLDQLIRRRVPENIN